MSREALKANVTYASRLAGRQRKTEDLSREVSQTVISRSNNEL